MGHLLHATSAMQMGLGVAIKTEEKRINPRPNSPVWLTLALYSLCFQSREISNSDHVYISLKEKEVTLDDDP